MHSRWIVVGLLVVLMGCGEKDTQDNLGRKLSDSDPEAFERTRRRGNIPDLGNAVFRATPSGLKAGPAPDEGQDNQEQK